MEKFEVKLNGMVNQGWAVHSFAQDAESTTVLMVRES